MIVSVRYGIEPDPRHAFYFSKLTIFESFHLTNSVRSLFTIHKSFFDNIQVAYLKFKN